jgi:hypothetical protein
LTIHEGDARTFLAQGEHAYDIVVLDAYSKTYVPFHLMTQEFFVEVANDLTPDGVIVSNLIASLVGDTSDLFRAELRTIGQVFPQVYVFPTSQAGISTVQNVIVVATKSRVFVDKAMLIARATATPLPHLPDLPEYVGQYYEPDIALEETPILTDDFAPVETLLNPITGRPYNPDEEGLVGPLPLVGAETHAWTLLGLIGIALLWGVTVRPGQTVAGIRMWDSRGQTA